MEKCSIYREMLCEILANEFLLDNPVGVRREIGNRAKKYGCEEQELWDAVKNLLSELQLRFEKEFVSQINSDAPPANKLNKEFALKHLKEEFPLSQFTLNPKETARKLNNVVEIYDKKRNLYMECMIKLTKDRIDGFIQEVDELLTN